MISLGKVSLLPHTKIGIFAVPHIVVFLIDSIDSFLWMITLKS